MIKKDYYGKAKGQDVYLFTLDNGKGLSAEIINYGGIIKSLTYQGVDVVLGRDTMEQYLDNGGCFGAVIGRNSNRLENAEITLNGQTYKLAENDRGNNIHGGNEESFRMKVWEATMEDQAEPSLKLSLKSPDGEEGFPGNVEVMVTYTLTEDNALRIDYHGTSDADTVMNLTNHSYFNLNGHDSGIVDGHTVQLDADFYTPNSDMGMPYGEILSVTDTAFDLRTPKQLADIFASQEHQIVRFRGFDHNFCLRGRGYRKIGTLTADKTNFAMEIYTDLPGVQIYTGNGISSSACCKNGVYYDRHHGICFETQAFPNAMAIGHFPSIVLKKGEIYQTTTAYKFI